MFEYFIKQYKGKKWQVAHSKKELTEDNPGEDAETMCGMILAFDIHFSERKPYNKDDLETDNSICKNCLRVINRAKRSKAWARNVVDRNRVRHNRVRDFE